MLQEELPKDHIRKKLDRFGSNKIKKSIKCLFCVSRLGMGSSWVCSDPSGMTSY